MDLPGLVSSASSVIPVDQTSVLQQTTNHGKPNAAVGAPEGFEGGEIECQSNVNSSDS